MQIEIIQPCLVHGEHAEVGEFVDVDDPTGKMLIGIGRAKLLQVADPTPQNADPTPVNQDPA